MSMARLSQDEFGVTTYEVRCLSLLSSVTCLIPRVCDCSLLQRERRGRDQEATDIARQRFQNMQDTLGLGNNESNVRKR
jgi:hypothetical protein